MSLILVMDHLDHLGSFTCAWWSLTAVVVVMLLMVTRFNPGHYARHIR